VIYARNRLGTRVCEKEDEREQRLRRAKRILKRDTGLRGDDIVLMML